MEDPVFFATVLILIIATALACVFIASRIFRIIATPIVARPRLVRRFKYGAIIGIILTILLFMLLKVYPSNSFIGFMLVPLGLISMGILGVNPRYVNRANWWSEPNRRTFWSGIAIVVGILMLLPSCWVF